MSSHIMDRRHSLFIPSALSSIFSEETRLPSERQLGLRKSEAMLDHSGLDAMSLVPGSKPVLSSPLEKLRPIGGNYRNFLELPPTSHSKEQKTKISYGNHFLDAESTLNLSMTSLGSSDQKILSPSTLCTHPGAKGSRYENSVFSSSLSEAFSKKLRFRSNDTCLVKSLGATNSKFVEDEPLESMKEIEAQTIGDLLPNDDDLLSGVIDDIECVAQTNCGDEDDLFCSGGGMEIEPDESFNCKRASDFLVGEASNCLIDSLRNAAASDLIYVEHPSRELIVRNINSNVEETNLRILFEEFGDIHAFFTANKHLGFIIVSYYDIRAARNAKRALQDRLLRQQKLDIRFYVPKDNASNKNINLATLTVVNLDSVVSKDQLHQIFGSYGEIKEIFHDPCNQNKRAIEFYDVRAAEAALCALNLSIIAGKRIMIEIGCSTAGWRSSLGKDPSLEVKLEKRIIGRKSGSPNNPSSVSSGSVTYGANTSMGIDNGPMQNFILQTPVSPLMENEFLGVSNLTHNASSPIQVMEGNHGNHSSHNELNNYFGHMNFGFQSMPTIHPHSLPELNDGLISNIPLSSLSTISPMHTNTNSRNVNGIDNQHFNRFGASCINNHSFEHKEAFGISGNGSYPVNGHQYVINNCNANFHQLPGSRLWENSPSFMNKISASLPPQLHGLPKGPSHMMNKVVPLQNHTYSGDCLELAFRSGSIGNMGFSASSPMHSLGIPSHNMYPHTGVNYIDALVSPVHVGSPSLRQRPHMFQGRINMTSAPASCDTSGERIRSRQNESSGIQVDNKKLFELDIDQIIHGEDFRTTLMIKNIPNKYTSKMLLATIDEYHKGIYDFIYLPIDFKNKCNVGYAFINLIDPKHIIPFYQALNGKKWEKFNSEKVTSIAYARIQGKAALISHFQNSSLMNEDKRCRPILFHSDGPNAGDQEPFPIGAHIRSRPGRSKSTNNEEHYQRSPSESNSGNIEYRSNLVQSSSSSNQESE